MSYKIVNAIAGLAALGAIPLSIAPAQADSVRTFSCVGTDSSVSCVATRRSGHSSPHIVAVPQPVTDEERAAAESREKRWAERCRPMVRQDEYGVPRYIYAARGCEYGRLD